MVAVHRAFDRRKTIETQRQLEVLRLVGQMLAERQLVGLVVDDHRVAERERREALGFFHRNVAQRRILDETRHVAHLERSELQRIDPRELQGAEAHAAHTGAERVGDRCDAEPLRGRARDHRVLRAGIDHEVLCRRIVDLRAHDDLLVHEPEVDRVQPLVVPRLGIERHFLTERSQEPDFRARPVGLLAVIFVGQQIDVVRVGRRRFFVFVHPLEDRADRVMNLEVARREPQRRLCLVHRLVEPAPRRHRSRQAVVAAREIGHLRERRAVAGLGLVEESRRPQGVAVERRRVRAVRIRLHQPLRLPPREVEFRDAEGRGNDADSGGPCIVQRRGFQRILVGVERVEISPLGVQKVAELELDFRRLRRRRRVGPDDEGPRRDDGRHCRETESALHAPSKERIQTIRMVRQPTRIAPGEPHAVRTLVYARGKGGRQQKREIYFNVCIARWGRRRTSDRPA